MEKKYQLEKYEYLFVNIAWNQKPGTTGVDGREMIKIGLLGTDEDLEMKKLFSKAVRLENIEDYNSESMSLSCTSMEEAARANSEEVILNKVALSFQKYKYVVVWTDTTYELLKRGMDRYKILMPRHRVVLFQQLLMEIAGIDEMRIGFERALNLARIEYNENYLHYPKHAVNYMYQLFCKCYADYKKWTTQENCYLNPRSHRLHTSNCRYTRLDEKSTFNKTTKDVIFHGNKVCRICGSRENWNRLQWDLELGIEPGNYTGKMRESSLTVENMSMICNYFRLNYNIVEDAVFIKTPFSRWIVFVKNNKVSKLQHENYRHKRCEAMKVHKKSMEGYHKQKLPSDNFYDVVCYIKHHDTSMIKRLGEKSRIEKIFDRINMQSENMA